MTNIVSGNTLNVNFRNTGFGTDEGTHTCQLFEIVINEQQKPAAIICNPFGMQDTKLIALFKNDGWTCDLD